MAEVHRISEHEALLRVADFCVKAGVTVPREDDFDIIMHRSIDYWVQGLYFQWENNRMTTIPKPLPPESILISLEVIDSQRVEDGSSMRTFDLGVPRTPPLKLGVDQRSALKARLHGHIQQLSRV